MNPKGPIHVNSRAAQPFSLERITAKVLSILQSDGLTTFADLGDRILQTDGAQEASSEPEQRTVHPRVYDVLNVFSGVRLITKEGKSISYRKSAALALTGQNHENVALIKERIEEKEKSITERTKLLMYYQLLIKRNMELQRPETALSLPAIFFGLPQVETAQVTRSTCHPRVEISTQSIPTFFSPMNIFEKLGFRKELQTIEIAGIQLPDSIREKMRDELTFATEENEEML
jgi:hypothetical protein